MATSEEIRNWFAANPGASDAQIAAAMQANNVSSGEVASALGVDPGMVAQRYAAATAPASAPAQTPAAAESAGPPVTPETWQLGVSGGLLSHRRAGATDQQYYRDVATVANKWLANPGTAAEAFRAMSQSGISVSDLLNAGISQSTIDNALMTPTDAKQVAVNNAALNSMTSTLAQNPLMAAEIGRTGLQTIYQNARDYVNTLQQGGLTDAERNKLREAAAGQGWSYADIRAAGIDPTILFGAPKPVVPTPVTPTPVTPTPVFPQPVPYTPVNVYQPLPQQPDIYAAGQPALDVAFRESAPRTAIPGMPGAYEYTPAAKLRPATGAGYTFTPPSVTSRPRSLLSPTLLSYVSPSQQFAQSRAAQDQALLGAFRQSGLPQNASNFYSWRNRLRSGEFGAGSAFDPTAFQSAFGSWAATQAPRTPAQGTAPVGDVTGYSEIAGRIQPIDLRTVPTFAEGGEASARELLDRLKKPEGTGEEVPGAVDQGPRNLPLERMNARRTRAGMGPFVPQAPTGTAGQEAADMLAALSLATAPLPVAGDISGLAADAAMYAAYPEERTLGNAALSVLGALPFVPAASAVRAGEKAADAIQQAPTEARQMLEEVAPAARQIDTPEFKNWFGESKATDAKGNPLVLYHGSPYSDIEEFSDQKTAYGYFFTPDADTADYYTGGRNEGKIYPVYLKTENLLDLDDELEFDRIAREALDYQEARDEEKVREFAARLYNEGYGKNPEVTKFFDQQEGFPDVGEDYSIEQLLSDNYVNQKEVDDLVARINLDKVTSAYEQSAPVFSPELEEARNAYGSQDFYMNYQDDFMRAAQNLGYDGVVFTDPSPAGESISYVVFDPTQIKSAIGNEGTFDPTNPVITKADGGEVTAPQTESRSMLERLQRFASLDTPQDMSLGETVADIGMGFLPIVGTAQGARDFERARREDDTLGMVLGAASMIPVVGGVAKLGKKAVGSARQMLEEVAPAARQIDTPAFKNWFGESKVADKNGNPLVMVHASPMSDINDFKPGKDGGIWFSPHFDTTEADIIAANPNNDNFIDNPNPTEFPDVGVGMTYYPTYLRILKPARGKLADDFYDGKVSARELQKQGYDGVIYDDDVAVVFDPTQLKSAIGNEGTFDPTNPVITKADGGSVEVPQTESRRLLDQVEAGNQGLRNLPLERMNARRARAGMDPYAPARPAASMLENIIRGGAAIPGTVGRYAERVVGSEDPLAKLGGDITGVGGAMLQGLKEDSLGFAADVAPIIGEIRSAADVDKYSALANEAIAAGNPALAKVYQEIVAMSAAGAVPLAGMATRVGGRVGKRGLIDAAERAAKEAAEQAPTEARQMLEALAPETGQLPAEDVLSPAITRPVEPMPLTESEKMLSELDEIQADLPETVRPTITEEIGDRRRVGTTGRYVGAPEGINTPQKLAALTRSITNLTKEGAFGRFWYERSGRQILDITGGNTEDADKLVQAIAITSPNTPVGANFDYALQAYYQWKNGQPIRTGMYTTAMSDKLQRMFDGEEWAGRKTNNFYNNLMREIDPSKAQGVTTDIWMMRAFGFGKDAPTDAQYSFVENETKRIAKNLGWEPQQVQAAIWVALKSRMENPDVKRAVEEKSFENGWITYNDEGERVVLDQNKHAANWLEKAMQHTPTEADREAAKFDYADAAANNLAQISWESIPSRTSGHMPEIFEAAPEVVQDYHVQMSKAFLDDDGNDIIAKEFDILSPGDFEAPGYFEQRVSPGTQTNITAPRQYGVTRRIEAIKKQAAEEGWSKEQRDAAIRAATYATDPSAREAMYAYAAARGILLKQDGVGMHRPAFITGLSRPKANGIEVSIGRPLTARETAEIARLVAAEAGHTEYNPIGSPSGVRFINFDYLGTPNLDFQKTVNNALKKMNFDNDEAVDAKMFGADTGYLSNNWKENFNGEGYLESGELARRPDLQRKVRDLVTRLAPRVSAVEEEFANRYSWNRNTNLNRSYETQQAVETPSGTVTPAPEIPELPATVRPFKRGGSVERMINDNRKYL